MGSILSYQVNWAILHPSETITVSAWTVTIGIALNDESNTTTTATIEISADTEGIAYATNHVTFASGLEDERTLTFDIEQR